MPVQVGYNAFVRFVFGGGTVAMHAVRWSVTWRVDALDESTFVNANWAQYTDGVQDYDISVDCLYDTLSDPFPPAGGFLTAQNSFMTAILQPGNYLGVSLEVVEGHPTRLWTFPMVYISDVRVDDSVRDLVRYSVNGKASNQIADVGGPVAPGLVAPLQPVA